MAVCRLPKILARAGCRVNLLSFEGSLASSSRHLVRHVSIAKSENSPFAQELCAHLEDRPYFYQWIIIGDDVTFYELAAQADKSWLKEWFPVEPGSDAVELCSSKASFVGLCDEIGISIPRSRVCHNLVQVRDAADAFVYPLVLKKAYGCAGKAVRRVDSAHNLEPAYCELAGEQPLVVQQFVDGLVGSTAVLFDRGTPAAWISAYKHLSWPTPFSPSCQRRFMLHDDIPSICQKLGKRLGFHGLCGFDWIHRPQDDSLCVLEFNMRPTPLLHLGHHCAVDFGYGARAMLDGHSLLQPPQKADINDRILYMFPQDLYRSLAEVDWRGLLRWFPGAALHDIPWDEPRMMARMLWNCRGHMKNGVLGLLPS
ncbi:hypothetical protein IAD21_03449 [Abditibacteriota bacterium]|nr:hypothetical protein IAD21_03449 [Abditibacteriota bacterium]